MGELETEQRVSTPDLDRGVREAEKRIANLTESLARVGWSDALAAKLAEEERRLAGLRGERAQKSPQAARQAAAVVPPDAASIRRYLRNLFALVEADAKRGREALAHHVRPIVMTPEAEGPNRRYRATGAVNVSSALRAAQVSARGARGSGKSSCAGALGTLEHDAKPRIRPDSHDLRRA